MADIHITRPVDCRVDPATGKFVLTEKGGDSLFQPGGAPVTFDPTTDTLVFDKSFKAASLPADNGISFFKLNNGRPVPLRRGFDAVPPFIRVANDGTVPVPLPTDLSILVERGAFVKSVDPVAFTKIQFNADKSFMAGKSPTLIVEDDKPHMGFPAGARVLQYPAKPGAAVLNNDAVCKDGSIHFCDSGKKTTHLVYTFRVEPADAGQKRLNSVIDDAKEAVKTEKEAEAQRVPAGRPKPKVPRYSPFKPEDKLPPYSEEDRITVERLKLSSLLNDLALPSTSATPAISGMSDVRPLPTPSSPQYATNESDRTPG